MKNPYPTVEDYDPFEHLEEFPSEDELLPFWDDLLCPADELLGWYE